MKKTKFYIQPLGLTRGCSLSGDNFRKIAGSDLHYSVLRIIKRTGGKITHELVAVAQLERFLAKQSDGNLSALVSDLERERPDMALKDSGSLRFGAPIIQGVLNVTPDSFSDGGSFDCHDVAINHAHQMVADGAKIIDVGGESTKPGASPVSSQKEKDRVLPVIEALSELNVPISIDSRNADVMTSALDAGASIINDVSALEHDPNAAEVAARNNVPVILMHTQGNPQTMQDDPRYDHVVLDIYDYLEARISFCLKSGISKDRIIIDPGIGFGKTVSHNLQILANLSLFHGLGVPILVGVSRKSFIGKLTGETLASNRVSGSISAAQNATEQGVQIVRVHDVAQTNQALIVNNAINDEIDTI